MSNMKYQKTEQITLSLKGFIDPVDMTIDIDGQVKKLSTLLSEFAGGFVEMSVKMKDQTDLQEPVEESDAE